MYDKTLSYLLPSFLIDEIFEPNNSCLEDGFDSSLISSGLSACNTEKTLNGSHIEIRYDIPSPVQGIDQVKTRLQNGLNYASNQNMLNSFQLHQLQIYLASQNIVGGLVHFLRSELGAEILSNLLLELEENSLHYLLDILSPHWIQLMSDSNASTFTIAIFKLCSRNKKISILNNLKDSFPVVATTYFGSLSLQDYIECLGNDDDLENIFLDNLRSPKEIFILCHHHFGCHVIKKAIACIAEAKRTHVNNVIISHFASLAVDKNGVLIILQFMKSCLITVNQEQIRNKILIDFFRLSQNQYGNYIIQQILEMNSNFGDDSVIQLVKNNFVKLSLHKISCYVIDKYLSLASFSDILEMYTSLQKNEKIKVLIRNKYGVNIISKIFASLNYTHFEMPNTKNFK